MPLGGPCPWAAHLPSGTPCAATGTLLSGNEHRGAFVLHQKDEKLCWLRLARIPPDDVHVIRSFVEGLSSFPRHFPSASPLHDHRPLQDKNEGVSVVTMNGICVARSILNRDHQRFLAGKAV